MKSKFESIINKQARYEYEVLDTLEAGMVLTGPEVKSIRNRRVNLKDAFVYVSEGQAYVVGLQISPYAQARQEEYDPKQSRKLLLNRKEINHLVGKLEEKRISAVPLKLYEKNNRFKLEIGLVRGKKEFQKKEAKKRRDIERETRRLIKDHVRYKG